jgi:hypothetical protein
MKGLLWAYLFYLIGAHESNLNSIPILERGMIPFITVCVIGLVLYITIPEWYLAIKIDRAPDNVDVTEGYLSEVTRLSAFWDFPYWISYGCAIFYTYFITKKYYDLGLNKKHVILLLFLLLIAVLSQQRASVGYIILVTLYYILQSLFRKRIKINDISWISMFVSVLIISVILFLSLVDESVLEILFSKFSMLSDTKEFVSDRADIFETFYKKPITIFGDGLGAYNHTAMNFNRPAITDHQYLKILYENGLYGCLGFLLIFLSVIKRAVTRFECFRTELGIIFFFLISMLGADCMFVSQEHSPILWYCCGRVLNTKHKLFKQK